MKKILSIILTVLMLITSLAILPVSADEAVDTETETYTAPIYYGAQPGTGTNANTHKIRFISLVPENLGTVLGYEIVVTFGENVVRYSAAEGDEKMESNKVYSSLLANTAYGQDTITAAAVAEELGVETAYGLFVVVIDNIPVDAQFDVRTYVKEDSDEPEDKSGCTGVTLTAGVLGTATPAVAWATQGGNGTAAYPYVLNQKNFEAFYNTNKATGQYSELKVNCELESDIVVNDNWSAAGGTTPSKAWSAPISYPSGVSFEGNGHTISGVYIRNTIGAANTGLFSEAQGCTISNLNIRNSYFEAANPAANKNIGSIAGFVNGSVIKNCFSDAIVVSNCDNNGEQNVGGIAGRMSDNSSVLNCVFAGSIYAARTRMGGIVGYSTSGNVIIKDCLNLGTIVFTGTNSGNAGGILGVAERYSSSGIITVSNCVNLSSNINAKERVGSIVSWNIVSSNATFTSCYTVDGYCVTNATTDDSNASTKVGSISDLNLDGWYYVEGYYPSPIEGLLIELPQ